MADGPLDGVTVVDLGQIYNAPYATLLMALAGARVIKIEPLTGENLRGRGRVKGAGAPFAMLNSNKVGATLNLKHPRGVELLGQMAERSDVLVENFRPGVMDRLGVGADVLLARNPRLIYASGSGYGTSGPYRDLPAMDLTVQAMAGIMSITGHPDREPVKAGPALGDFLAGIHLYGAIMTALYQRSNTGVGTRVEVAMLDSVYPSLMSALGLYFGGALGGGEPARQGNRHSGLAESPYNAYPTTDGHVALICVSEGHWVGLTTAMGRPDLATDPRYTTRVDRVARMDEVDELVSDWTRGFTRVELVKLLTANRVPCAPVREISEVVHDEHLHQRGMLHTLDHPEFGEIVVPHSPLRIGEGQLPLRPSPTLGQDNEAVYGDWLQLSREEIDDLRAEGVL
ncbi:MAG TPA: CoA transferase [Pseudonocardia sp.]|jgi:crotonobetainyl-CoA:carnitine CoA-transferase CaiB-like acyl-CoA transferase|nr:CoA transferase [Pseudonocardia sp.]